MSQSITPTASSSASVTTGAIDHPAEFVVRREDLLQEIGQIQGAISRKSTIPILNNILMQVTTQGLFLTATDLDLSIRTSCPGRAITPGAFTIPARKLYDYLRLLPDGEIKVKVLANDWVQLRCGRSHTKMVGLPRTNFPTLPLFPRDASLTIEADILRDLIARTVFAISKDESRYTLNGALLLVGPQGITMVATDGHRMAVCEQNKCKSLPPQERRLLVSRKALTEIGALLAQSTPEHIQIADNDSTLFFVIGKRLLTARSLAGRFPDYQAVLPRVNNQYLLLERDEMYSSIMRVAQFADDRSNAIRLRFEKDELKLSSSTVETGESEDILPTSYKGERISIGFNSQYLLDFLKVTGSERVRLEFKDSQSAIELKPDGAGAVDGIYRYIVMPTRI
jgi:DNA polymerase III subunit beta